MAAQQGAAGQRQLGQVRDCWLSVVAVGCDGGCVDSWQAMAGHCRQCQRSLPPAYLALPLLASPLPFPFPSLSCSSCSTLRLWDPRAAPGQCQVARVQLPGKVYTMSASDSRLVVGMAGRGVDIFDLRT